MTHIHHISGISPEAFAELKKICIEEFGDTMTDGEICQMGVDLLNMFEVLLSDSEPRD